MLPGLFPILRTTHVGHARRRSCSRPSSAASTRSLVGLALMRLSGLPAGIATFAVLGITYNLLRNWEKIGPAAQALNSVPGTSIWTLMLGCLISVAVAYAYQRSRFGRQLRATREDPAAAQASGIDVYRQRLVAFTLSGALAAFAGGLLVHELG